MTKQELLKQIHIALVAYELGIDSKDPDYDAGNVLYKDICELEEQIEKEMIVI